MSDPIYIEQTANAEHLKTESAMLEWFYGATCRAKKAGGTFFRYSWDLMDDMLLIEAWTKHPITQSEPRWKFDHDGKPS